MTEQDLIKLCKKEDPKGQKLLFNRFIDPMSRLCLRYLQDESDAVEAMSEGFVKVYKSIHRFEYVGEGSLFAWVKRIMVNESLMYLRRNKCLLTQTDLNEAGHCEVSDDYLGEIEAEYLYEAIRNLPTGCSTVFNLYEIEGFSHKEIAGELGITESSSRAQLARAKNHLRKLLKK